MSNNHPLPTERTDSTQEDERGTPMSLDYANVSHVTPTEAHQQHVALFTDLRRDAVSFDGVVTQPLLFRDSLLALFDVVKSDYRYVPKDRAAYAVFSQMRRQNRNKNLFTAQRDYFNWLLHNDPLAYCILDPIIEVHPDGVSFEVFGRDEGCYAQLTLAHSLFTADRASTYGTTSIDYSDALAHAIARIDDSQAPKLSIGQDALQFSRHSSAPASETDNTEAATQSLDTPDDSVIEKRIHVPSRWIRGLLQIQAAAQLPMDSIALDPIALYNVLFELRMHADIKGKRRGLIIELTPNQPPVMLLEPFNISVNCQLGQAKPYSGSEAKMIRLWGRRRLSLLKRLLPYAKDVTVHILGQGMPSYWVIAGEGFSFTFAMTGFNKDNWSQALNFDLLLPKRPIGTQTDSQQETIAHIIQALQDAPKTLEDLCAAKDNALSASECHTALITAAQQGLVRYDMPSQRYHYRPLTQTPLDMAQFAYHNDAEKQAFAILAHPKSFQRVNVKSVLPDDVMISADIEIAADRRSYHSQLTLGHDGLVKKAECSCPQYLQHRLSHGPCAHLIALRLYQHTARAVNAPRTRIFNKRLAVSNNEQAQTPQNNALRKNTPNTTSANIWDLTAPSMPINANNHTQTHSTQLSVHERTLLIEREQNGNTRRQKICFNTAQQATDAMMQHAQRLQAKGYIEDKGI